MENWPELYKAYRWKSGYRMDGKQLAKHLSQRGMAANQRTADLLGIELRTLQDYLKKGKDRVPCCVLDTRFEGIVEGLDTEPPELLWGAPRRFRAVRERMLDDSVDLFDTRIADLTSYFADGSRQFVFDRIREVQDRFESSYVVVEGDPGSGKSTIAARFAEENDCARHFNMGTEGITDPRQGIRNLCRQIMSGYVKREVGEGLPQGSEDDGGYLQRVLLAASNAMRDEDEKVLVVVDALDEVNFKHQDLYSNVLYLPRALPPRVHVVVSMRRSKDVVLVTSPNVGRVEINLREHGPENRADAAQYVAYRLEEDEVLAPRFKEWAKGQRLKSEKAVEAIVEKSEANFMYLRHAVEAIGRGELVALGKLPQGLTAYYADHLRRMQATSRERLKVLYYLSDDPGTRRTAEELAQLAQLDVLDVQRTLNEWRAFLVERADGSGKARYSIYHASFCEFLQQDGEVRAAIGLGPGEVGARLAAAAVQDFGWHDKS